MDLNQLGFFCIHCLVFHTFFPLFSLASGTFVRIHPWGCWGKKPHKSTLWLQLYPAFQGGRQRKVLENGGCAKSGVLHYCWHMASSLVVMVLCPNKTRLVESWRTWHYKVEMRKKRRRKRKTILNKRFKRQLGRGSQENIIPHARGWRQWACQDVCLLFRWICMDLNPTSYGVLYNDHSLLWWDTIVMHCRSADS